MIAKPVHVKVSENYTLWLKYSDGTEGHVDLSYLLEKPVFSNWKNAFFFNKVHINLETYAIAWDENIELCPDSLYLKIKGLTFEQWKSNQMMHAAGK